MLYLFIALNYLVMIFIIISGNDSIRSFQQTKKTSRTFISVKGTILFLKRYQDSLNNGMLE